LKDVADIKTISHLTLTGNIDARDVAFMRDSMPLLAELDLSGATIVGYEGEDGTVQGSRTYPANEMPENSFYNYNTGTGKTTLISLTLPDGLTTIGSYAFRGCSSLASLTLPDGLTAIGDNAFSDCSSLASLTLPDGLTTIGNEAFYGCSSLASLTLPDGLTAIGGGAFWGCSNLASLTLPAGLTTIGYDAFRYCSSLASLTLPAGLTTIGNSAFWGCSSLASLTNFSPTPVVIDSDVFAGVPQSACTLTVSEGAVAAYEAANVWTDFYITGGGVLLSVKHNALGGVTGTPNGLYSQGEPVTLTAIPAGGFTFFGWISGTDTLSLESVLEFTLARDTVLTAAFGKVGHHALTTEGTLKDVADIKTISHLTLTGYIDARDVAFMRDSMPLLAELDLRGAVIVSYNGEGGTSPWGSGSYPANEMPVYSFYNFNTNTGKTTLISLTLPAGVTTIGFGTFYGCSSLASVTLPAGLTAIGDEAFYGCSSLASLTLPDGLTTIEYGAFSGCSSLASVTLPDGLTTIG
jgi:hypothetical protein